MSDSYELKAGGCQEAGFRPDTGEPLPVIATGLYLMKETLTSGNVEVHRGPVH